MGGESIEDELRILDGELRLAGARYVLARARRALRNPVRFLRVCRRRLASRILYRRACRRLGLDGKRRRLAPPAYASCSTSHGRLTSGCS